jgi:hypothetical protein
MITLNFDGKPRPWHVPRPILSFPARIEKLIAIILNNGGENVERLANDSIIMVTRMSNVYSAK